MSKEQTFMGQPVTEAANGKLKVSKSGQNTILEELGLTKDIRKVIATAEETITKEAIEFTGKNTIKTKKDTVLEIGTGASKTTFSMVGKKEVRSPADGSTSMKYGQFSIRKRGVVPTALKSNELEAMSAAIEKRFK